MRNVLARIGSRPGWLALAGVVLLALLAVSVGSLLPFPTSGAKTRQFTLSAEQFAYSPYRLRVNKGDTVILRLEPQDVTHGLYIDGYGLETNASPDETAVLEFVADKPGTFRFRCSVTCGSLHPFMIGQLSVEPNAPFAGSAIATLLAGLGAVAYGWWRKGNNGTSD